MVARDGAPRSSVSGFVSELDARLRTQGDPVRAVQEKRYLKSDLEHYGVTVPAVRRTVKHAVAERSRMSRTELLGIVRELWKVPVHERRSAAIELLEQRVDDLREADMPLLERLLRECRGWALLDNLAASVVGPLVERLPAAAPRLDRWAVDADFWMRRAALLALLIALREGRGDFERFGRYADGMLGERELFIRKAIGWVLRDTSKKRPDLVVDWLRPRLGRASGLTVREGVKRLPEMQRRSILGALERSR
jgi:3-methyladenine DNA glycosylase AlkD